jgi:hypothetical protein
MSGTDWNDGLGWQEPPDPPPEEPEEPADGE